MLYFILFLDLNSGLPTQKNNNNKKTVTWIKFQDDKHFSFSQSGPNSPVEHNAHAMEIPVCSITGGPLAIFQPLIDLWPDK